MKQPWPSMLRNDLRRSRAVLKQYWSQIPGMYFTGDGARKDEDGYFWLMGRVDDVINVGGHRLEHDGDGVGAGGAHDGGRGRGGGRPDDDEGAGDGGVRHVGARATSAAAE